MGIKNRFASEDYVTNSVDNIIKGDTPVAQAANAETATKDANGDIITSTYETKTDAEIKLAEAKSHTDEQIESHVHSWNELEDKPFYKEIVSEGFVFECNDGYLEYNPDVYTLTANDNNGYVFETSFIKISDFVPTENQLNNVFARTSQSGGTEGTGVCKLDFIKYDNGCYVAYVMNGGQFRLPAFIYIVPNQEIASSIGVNGAGIYIDGDNYVDEEQQISYSITVFRYINILSEEKIVQLDSRYIKDMYYEKDTYLIPYITLEFTTAYSGGIK